MFDTQLILLYSTPFFLPTRYNIYSAKVVNPREIICAFPIFFYSHPSAGGQASSLLFHKQTLFLSQRNEGLCHSRAQNKNSVLKIKPPTSSSLTLLNFDSHQALSHSGVLIFSLCDGSELNTHCRSERTQCSRNLIY